MRVISRLAGDGIEVFDAGLSHLRTVPVPAEPRIADHAVSPARDRVVYVTGQAVVCVDEHGHELWRRIPEPAPAVSCAWSGDGELVWLHLGNGADPDQWVALAPATGEVRLRYDLGIAGLGGRQLPFPDGRHMLLEIGEGENGCRALRGGAGDEPRAYPWDDRSVVDIAPSGEQLMTVSLDQDEVAFHDLPGGAARVTLGVEDFGADPADAVFEWAGGYRDAETAIVVISGDQGGEPWWRHHRVDPRTGEVLGDLGIVTIDEYDLQPLGDGTYVITDTDGTLRRM